MTRARLRRNESSTEPRSPLSNFATPQAWLELVALNLPPSDPLLANAAEPALELAERYRALEKMARRLAEALESATGLPLPEAGAEMVTPHLGHRPPMATVETPTGDVAALLDFQEQLGNLDGVMKVTVAGTTGERTTFIVELGPETADESQRHRVLCVRCGDVLVEGREPASHGLCESCRMRFGTEPT